MLKASISDLEHGRQSKTLLNLYTLAQYLDTTSDYLLGLTEDKSIHSTNNQPSENKNDTT